MTRSGPQLSSSQPPFPCIRSPCSKTDGINGLVSTFTHRDFRLKLRRPFLEANEGSCPFVVVATRAPNTNS
ncbi:hypothetical protein JTE90_000357 [Oedothorax gibbosus]|uniref:Uncharacterized protein n=1 Tax=Oedothorax gibbosus TaxID=931172 RepID=A0AAV6U1B8_9ARAC|nr:hypothetical protein JTE90_000357 [Oedothorax gibbosus]